MNVLFIFEFGAPFYRRFVVDGVSEIADDVKIVSGSDRFEGLGHKQETRLAKVFNWDENILYWLSPRTVHEAEIIFTTLNLRRPHTWIYIFIFPKKRWILWGQGRWKAQSLLLKMIRSAIFKYSDGFIVYTEGSKKNLISQGYPAEKISVAYNTLMVSNAEATNGADYFLYVGRLQERKDIELAIKSIKGTGHLLRIVGDGDYKSRLLVFAENLGVLDQIDFHIGSFDDDVLKKHFSGAIAYISPGHVGLGVVHAFAYGVPVITLNSRDHAPEFEYCLEENSYLCSDEDQLSRVVADFDFRSPVHLSKRKAAFEFYMKNLSPKNMISCFSKYL